MALAHALETVPHRGSQYSKESQSALGTWSLNREHLFIPGGKHEQTLMNPHCLGLAPMEEAAEFPTPQVSGRKEWPSRQEEVLGVEEKWPEWLREGNKCLHSLAPEQRAQKP